MKTPSKVLRGLASGAAIVLFAAAIFGACKQGEGDRCQVDGDCEDGLICCVALENVIEGGSCRTAATCELSAVDGGSETAPREAGPETSEGGVDAAPDAAPDQATHVAPDTPASDTTVDTTSPDQSVDAQDGSAG